MRKNKSTLYFEKRYCLLVHSLTLTQRLSLTAFSLHSAEQETIDRTCTYNLNQIVYLSCVDLVSDGATTPDSHPTLHFTSLGARQYQRSDLAQVRFDMNTEKIVKPESSLLFSKELEGGRGSLNYKFINLKTRTLTQEEFEANRNRRNEAAADFGFDEASLKIEELMHLLQQKDELINRLETKIDDLIHDNRKRNQSGEREGSKDRHINLNVKVNAANEFMRRENERLVSTLRDQNERVLELEQQVGSLTKEKETLEREVNMCKKQLKEYEGLHSMSKSKIRRSINPSFLRTSTIEQFPMKQSYAEYPNITVEPARIRQSMVQESENTQNNLKQSSIRQSNMRHSHVLNSQANSNAASNPAQNRNKSGELDEDGLPESLPGEEVELEKRISIQKEDYKFRSIIFDRLEEIDILKKKLELRVAEVKALEKELEKSKVQLKKKEVEIRELRKQSRKNLFFGDSNKDLGGGGKHRVEIEQEFDRLQNEHDKQKITLQQQIERIERENDEKGKELKKLKLQLEQSRAHEKTYESKYNEIKVNMNKNVEDYIEYKEKAQQYDNSVIKNKELQGTIKSLELRASQLDSENKRMEALLGKNNARWSEREREWEKLKKVEREFEYMRGQNTNLRQSIDSYQSRYNELKRYCQKLEVAYNRFVTAKRRSGTESKFLEDNKEDKEIQEKFMDLSRKVNDCEINYYKQQLEDLNEEKSFAVIYFDRKLRDEKDKIHESKSYTEEEKRTAIFAKEQEIERNISEKMEEINSKILKLEKTYGEANQRLSESGHNSFILSIPDKMKLIERKLSMMMDREQERIAERHSLKETILQISQQLKMKPSSSAVEIKRISSNNLMAMSMMGDKIKQHLATVEEAKQRSQQSQQRAYEETRQKNNNLIKENGDLKMKNQKLTLEMDKIERKTQERQKTLEVAYKKMEDTNRYKIDALSEKIENVERERDHFKTQLAECQKSIQTLTQELQQLSQSYENKQRELMELQEKIMKYEERIRDYEQGERQMMEEVSIIKRNSEQNQQDLIQLMEERNNSFMKIQRTKEIEIQKLTQIIKEIELKLEAEMMENMQHRDKIESMKNTLDCTTKENQERIEQLTVAIENKQREFDEIFIKDYQLGKENEVLQTNLIDISNDISNKEMEIAELTYQLVSANKQTQIYKSQASEFSAVQRKLREQIKNLQSIVDDKIYQLKFFEQKMIKFKQDVEMSSKEMQRVHQINFQLENENRQHKDEYMANRDEIIKLKQHISLVEIDFKKQEMYIEEVEKMNDELKHHIQELDNEIARLNEVNNQLKISRKKSSEQDVKFDVPSPGRKKMSKRPSSSLDVPEMSSIGQGNITPIIPVSPHILSRRIDNPFEPRSTEDQNLGRSNLRKTSIEAAEQANNINQTNIQYAINVEQPHDIRQPLSNNHTRNISSVNIELDEGEDTGMRNTSRQPSFFRSLVPSNNNNMNIQIQEEESNQENTVNFGRNIELGDSKEQNGDHDIEDYIEKINELKRQLFQSNQQNERFMNEIVELEKQNDELMQHLQQLQVQPLMSKKSSLSVSRRKTIEMPAFSARPETMRNEANTDKHLEEKNLSQDDKILRSQSGFNLHSSRDYMKIQNNLGNYGQLQEKYEEAEVQLQYLSDALNAVKVELEQQVKNNQKLIEEAEFCRETIQHLEERIEQSNFEVEQYKKFQVFEQMYQNQINRGKELEFQLEQLHMETFQKDGKMSDLMKQNSELMEQINAYRGEANHTEDERINLQQKIKDLTNHINKIKIQYRKYEEESELEIIHLKETVDELKDKMKVKEEEIITLGEKYIDLQNKMDEMLNQIDQKDKDLSKKEHNSNEAENRYLDLENEIHKIEESRQNLFKRVRQLEQELNQRNDNISNFSKETALTIKKFEIKLQSSKEELTQANQKVSEKEKVISLLKNEIGLYNQQCDELKKTNDELTYELNKVEKELKDIMRVYEKELEGLRSQVEIKDDHIGKLTHLIKEKQNEYNMFFKQIRSVQKERDQYKSEYVELQSGIDKLKQGKAREYNEVYTQLQLKINEYEKIKSNYQKVSQELNDKEEHQVEQTEKYENKLKGYKERLQHYEKAMEEFEIQLKKLSKRPTSDQHEQILFQNEVLRNRIEELQSDVASAETHKKEDLVYMEFRKYKTNKEREILDLEAEMEKYGLKINELEETVFYLKKENETLRRENFELSDVKEEMMMECEDLKESLTDMEKQLLFYKNRKILDMQKLLNDTNE